MLVTIDLENDIRMSALQIPTPLLGGSIQVPYVDRLGDGKTGFNFNVRTYIGGYDGSDTGGYIPGKHLPHHLAPERQTLKMHATHSRSRQS